jgi:tRNA/tmRNA/rRNA uracil-C5-methylase (TrmA/RlmC/RlmD family)
MLVAVTSEPLIDLDITGVAHGGVFVGRHEGRVVFVPDAIPGERVRVRLTETSKKSFWRGETIDVVDASPHRRPHVWAAADVAVAPEHRPGGADFGHIALHHQRDLKARVILDALERIGGITDVEVTTRAAGAADATAPETPDGTRWRTRLGLHVDDAGRVGPFAARSHRVIEVDDHPLATEAIARAAARLSGGKEGRIELVQPSDGRVRVLPVPAPPPRTRGRRAAPPRRPETQETITEIVDGRSFRLDVGGFWQVHRLAAASLHRAVTDALTATSTGADAIDPDATHLDLYGGVGLFAATLATLGGPATRVTTVESDARATEYAGENLAEWVGARAETGRVDRWLTARVAEASPRERERISRGLVLLDPPRAGAGREVVEQVATLAPERIVYVACDPVALARDLATLRVLGYEPVRFDALDLFPNSHHVEAVVVLTRSGGRD